MGSGGDQLEDATDAATIERRLRDSEMRFRALTTATSDVLYRMSADWLEMRQLDGRGFIADTDSPSIAWIDEYLLPEDQPAILAVIEDAVRRKGVFQLEHRVRRVDGSVGWTFSRAIPLMDDAGEIIEWFGAASDVTERRRSEEHLKLMVDELNHRVKNNLAMIQAIAAQAFRGAGDLSAVESTFSARIVALAQANDLLTGERSASASLRGVLDQALGAHVPAQGRYTTEGPEIVLAPKTAHALSLAVHELATNAVKHGAWSVAGGRVAIRWSTEALRDAGRRLHLEWQEHGGPPVSPPARRGFGSRLIERGLAGELGGGAQLRFEPAGVICVIDAPLAA